MQDGLYGVKFETLLGAGAGVLIKQGGAVFGGDSSYAWEGHVSVSGDHLEGQLEVQKHDPTLQSVFGPLQAFTLVYEGVGNGPSATLNATTPSAPGVAMTIVLTLLKPL